MSEVVLAAVTVALTPPIKTVLPVVKAEKLLPLIVTAVPTGPDKGINEVMRGGAVKVPLVPVPVAVVTVILPAAPIPITAVILLAEFTVKEAAGIPPKFTAVTPVKLVPLMFTTVPCPPDWGLKELISGPR